jgi:hypothetical protein
MAFRPLSPTIDNTLANVHNERFFFDVEKTKGIAVVGLHSQRSEDRR